MKRAPVRSRKQTKPHQSGLFKRFTLLVVGLFKDRFVWARRKPDTTDADHDKRIAENYVYDEVLGVNVPRSEFERRAKFNNGDYKLTPDEIKRFPSRPCKVDTFDAKLKSKPPFFIDDKSVAFKLKLPLNKNRLTK